MTEESNKFAPGTGSVAVDTVLREMNATQRSVSRSNELPDYSLMSVREAMDYIASVSRSQTPAAKTNRYEQACIKLLEEVLRLQKLENALHRCFNEAVTTLAIEAPK